MVLRFANADVLPYDYVEFARTMQRYVTPIERALSLKGWSGPTLGLRSAIGRMEREAVSFAAARDSVLAASAPGPRFNETNARLRDVERALTRPAGLRSRPWYRNLIYVADENNGYANMSFPSVNEAIRAGNQQLAAEELSELTRRFDDATSALTQARSALAHSR
jgi:N-acetylated-alpha-linked acidic dipeptidase